MIPFDAAALRHLLPDTVAGAIALDGACELLALPSLSGHAARLRTRAGDFVVRRPDGAAIAVEAEATRCAHRLGFGPELVHADPAHGIVVTRWIEGTVMTARRFRGSPGSAAAAGRTLRRLHDAKAGQGPIRSFGAVIAGYEAVLQRAGDPLHAPAQVARALAAATEAVADSEVKPVPSHGDPLPSNWVAAPPGMYLLDWTYAGLDDPAWDLAYLALEGAFDAAHERELLAGYGAGAVDLDRLAAFKLPAAWIGALWGRVEAGRRPHRPELAAWTEVHLRLAAALAADPDILARIGALR